jgi:ribosomal protein L15
MVVKHKKKNRRKLGYERHSGLRRRGKGNRGGVGRAGQGKRGKQKKHKFMDKGRLGFGKHGFKSKSKSVESVSVGFLSEKAEELGVKKAGKFVIDVKRRKVLGSGLVKNALVLTNYNGITEKAKQKIVKSGGEVKEK